MQVLQFEEGFGDSTHCALIKAPEPLRAGLVDKVVELARNLQRPSRKNPLGAFAVVSTEDAGIFWVMNWEGSWKTNGKREIETKLEQIAVYKKPRPGNLAGLLLWIRPMQQYLKKRLEGKEVTYARPAAPKFYAKRPEQLHGLEKLEIMSEYMEECDLTGESKMSLYLPRASNAFSANIFKRTRSYERNVSRHSGNGHQICAQNGTWTRTT